MAALIVCAGFSLPLAADRQLELAVKATFLYKFAPFVTWPAEAFDTPSSPFRLCVVGTDPFGALLDDAVRGQTVMSRPIALRRLASVDRQSGCHAVFVSGSAVQSAAEALRAVDRTATLTVTDATLGPHRGIVHFVITNDRVTFDIDNAAAARNRLSISSKLLALARNVRGQPLAGSQ